MIEEKKVDIVVWMQPNVPIRKDGDIDKVVEMLIDSDADSVLTMSPISWPLEKASKIVENFIVPYWSDPAVKPRRQDYPEAYFSNGSVLAFRRDFLREQRSGEPFDYFLGEKRLAYIVSSYKFGIEIDNEEEFNLCEMFLKNELCATERETR